MRILVSFKQLGINGVAGVAIENARALRERGHEVFLFAIPAQTAARARAAGLELVGQPEDTVRPTWRSVSRVRRVAADLEVDVVHAYAVRPCLEAFFGAHLIDGVPMITSLLHNPTRTTPAYLPRTIPYVVGRERVISELRAQGVASVSAVRSVVSRDEPAATAAVDAFRTAHRLHPDDRVLLAVSRLGMHRDLLASVETVVDAAELLARRDARVRLVVVGDGAARPAIEDRANAVNMRAAREVVTLVGGVADLAVSFAASDVVVAMATSALRAMAYGKPTVVTGPDGTMERPDADALERYRSTGAFARGLGGPDVEAVRGMLAALLDDPTGSRDLATLEQLAVATHWSPAAAAEAIEHVYAEAITARPGRTVLVADAARSGWRYGLSRAESVVQRTRRTLLS